MKPYGLRKRQWPDEFGRTANEGSHNKCRSMKVRLRRKLHKQARGDSKKELAANANVG